MKNLKLREVKFMGRWYYVDYRLQEYRSKRKSGRIEFIPFNSAKGIKIAAITSETLQLKDRERYCKFDIVD